MAKKIEFDFFNIQHNDFVPEKGTILISEPFLQDSYFSRAIILLTEHGPDGSVGFILNKPVNINITELINDFPDFPAQLSIGGPVNNDRIYYLHTLGPKFLPGSTQVVDNIYWGGEFNLLKKLIISQKAKIDQIKFFLGYSGWAPKQLITEIKKDFWLVSKIDPSHIMTGNTDLWNKAITHLGKKYKHWINFPENPNHN